jgi:hypothetical protein
MESSLWCTAMPVDQHQTRPSKAEKDPITYGDYFKAVSHFLTANCQSVAKVAKALLDMDISDDAFESFAIYLEKHGAFYHPSRIVASLKNRKLTFVLNVAVSDLGKAYLYQEYENLNRLSKVFFYDYLPKVYARGSVGLDRKRSVRMFLGEWFDGYAEFHVSEKNEAGRAAIKVWDQHKGPYLLSSDQAVAIYAKAAEILTAYYSVETYEQIFSWHHAAGDFIIKFDDSGVGVKLVTVRRYDRIIENEDISADAMVHALLIFLLNMSIRMRIDRVDGVGTLTWLDDDVVEGTLFGFFNGLELKENSGFLPSGFAKSFKNYLLQIPKGEIEELFEAIVNHFPPEAQEFSIIRAHLKSHTTVFIHALTCV